MKSITGKGGGWVGGKRSNVLGSGDEKRDLEKYHLDETTEEHGTDRER